MSIDTSEFLDVLMEDSMEALSDMETSLLELDNGGDDTELINTIFRGAHSIKGGSGMLGLEEIAGFTHLMETLLDQVREGERKIDMPIVGLLLECVDALRGMFDALKDGSENDATLIANLKERLSATLENRQPNIQSAEPVVQEPLEVSESEPEVISVPDPDPLVDPEPIQAEEAAFHQADSVLDELAAADAELGVTDETENSGMDALLAPADDFVMPGWAVQFVPDHDLFLSGYDPLALINQLAALGGVDVKCDANVMPALQRINPEQCYLAWDINIVTDVDADAIRAIFAPVINQCELIIEPLQEAHANQLRAIIADQEASRKEVSGQDAVSYLRETVMGGSKAPETEIAEPVIMDMDEPLVSDEAVEPLSPPEPAVVVEELVTPPASAEFEPQCEPKPDSEREPESAPIEAVVTDFIEPVPDASEAISTEVAIEPDVKLEPEAEESRVQSEPVQKEQKVAAADVAPVPVAAPKASAKTSGRIARERKNSEAGGSIRVSTQKIDALINMAGELVITQAMLAQLGEKLEDTGLQEIEHLRDGLAQLERNSRELQDAVMSIRMLPISFAFSRFPRMIRDLTTKLDKKVRLVTTGEQTELDKTVMEKIGDPLVHLVRNSFDHGIEMPEDRRKAGKDEIGTIELNAYHQGGNIVIEVVDDGKGLDKDVIVAKAREKGLLGPDEQVADDKALELIFEPGFSTAAQVSDLSGRGVGMDVVRRNIRDLGGHIELDSTPGEGTRFTIRLPLTLAILDGQLVTVGDETFIVPLISIVESLQIQPEQMKTVAGQNELYHLREDYIPVVKLHELFDIKRPAIATQEHDLLVVVEGDGEKIALQVDDLLGQQQAFIKSLETNFKPVTGISGATILGDGTVSLILDAGAIVRMASNTGA